MSIHEQSTSGVRRDPVRVVAWIALLCAVVTLGFGYFAYTSKQGGTPNDPNGGPDGPLIGNHNPGGNGSSNGSPNGSSNGSPNGSSNGSPINPATEMNLATRSAAERTTRYLAARAAMPRGTKPLPDLAAPDSITIIVRDLQGYSDDCGCSGPAIGGITRVAALVPEVLFPVRGAAVNPRTYVFVGRMLIPELTLPSLRAITMSQAEARISVTAKFLAALPKVVWVADPGELAELETEGIDWSPLKPFMHDPTKPLMIEGMQVAFPKPGPEVVNNVPGELAKPTKDNKPRTPLEGPGVPPTWLPSIGLISRPAVDDAAKPDAITWIPMPVIHDRARNAVIVGRWDLGDSTSRPVLDETHSDRWVEGGVSPPGGRLSFPGQYRTVRQSPGDTLVNSALRRQSDNARRGLPWAAWWSELIAHGFPEDSYIRHVVDRAEFETGHSGVSLGTELESMVGDVHARWQSCQTCHPKAYEAWKTSRHSMAYQTLRVAKRHVDARCVSCHTQHVEVEKNMLKVAPDHQAVTCMTCHVKDEKPMSRCVSCHNDTTDPKGHWRPRVQDICPGDTVDPGAEALKNAGSDGSCNRGAKVPAGASKIPVGHSSSQLPGR